MRRERRSFKTRIRKTAGGLILLSAVSLVCEFTSPLPETVAFLLLLSVLVIATFADMWVAIILSLAADISFLWFLPPANSFAISGAPAWIALLAFLATAIIGSQLSVRAQRRAREAEARNLEMERIHVLGRDLLPHDTVPAACAAAVRQIVSALQANGAALYSAHLECVQQAGAVSEGVPEKLRRVFESGEAWIGGNPRVSIYPLNSGDHRIGALAIESDGLSGSALDLTNNLIAVALERALASERAIEATTVSRNEELRRTLVDAFSHNLKTPLTSIKASTSALLRRANVNEETRELLTVVDEETDRLIRLIADSLELVRVGDRVAPARVLIPVSQPIHAAIQELEGRVEGRKLEIRIPESVPAVAADPHLIQIVMSQLLDNALKYSPPDSPIEIQVTASAAQVSIAVKNEGAEIDEDERHRIFDKFYRGRKSRGRIEGTGMGLAIARTIVESHGGGIEARNDPQSRIVFEFSLPLAQEIVLEDVIV
jgi:two-component system sensor histidine kinase KdpD